MLYIFNQNRTPRSDSANLEPSDPIFCPQILEPRYTGGGSPHDGNASFVWPGTDPAWGQALVTIAHHMLAWHRDLDSVRDQWPRLMKYVTYLSKPVPPPPPSPASSQSCSTCSSLPSLLVALKADVNFPKAGEISHGTQFKEVR